MQKKQILFIGGSLNQTTMMHQIASQLPEYSCFFTPFFDDGLLGEMSQKGLLDFTILGGQHRQNTEQYLAENNLPIDEGGKGRTYDLVVTCTDLVLPQRINGKKLILVQEGMLEPEGFRYQLVRRFGLPRFLANTAATGLSYAYDLLCVASQGYREVFINKGVPSKKIAVTGIPNYDNVRAYSHNDFPYHHYVLAATSSNREAFQWEDRKAFIQKARQIAAGRKLFFKLHPNEVFSRARQEIGRFAPEAGVFETGNVHHMIANCDVLITQTSSVTFTGLALKKEVYSDLDLEMLRHLMPIQNGGTSASQIAKRCRDLLNLTPIWPSMGKQKRNSSVSQAELSGSPT